MSIETYSEAKKALNASIPERVVCRVKETEELENYLIDCFENNCAVSLYVNGQPGTGKTLLVNHTLDTLKVVNINSDLFCSFKIIQNIIKNEYKFKSIFLNCMSLKNMQSLYKIMTQELGSSVKSDLPLTPSKRSTKESLSKSVEAMLMSLKHHM